jgi:hypothetical protein
MKKLPQSFYPDAIMLLLSSVMVLIRAEDGGEIYIITVIIWALFLILVRIDLIHYDIHNTKDQ